MQCPNCHEPVEVSKNLQPEKSASPQNCSNCGESLDKSEGGNRDLIMK